MNIFVVVYNCGMVWKKHTLFHFSMNICVVVYNCGMVGKSILFP